MNRALVRSIVIAGLMISSILSVALASDAAPTTSTRLGGADRYATAALVAERVIASSGADVTAVLVTGANFPDALVAGTWPGESVIVLTRPDAMPWETLGVLARPAVTRIVIVGGTAVVSARVEAAARSLGKPVERVAGTDRYLTSAAVAARSGPVSSLWLAPGDSFVDILNAMAEARRVGGVVALVPPDASRLNDTVERLSASLAPGAPIHLVDSKQRVATISTPGHQVSVKTDSPFTLSAANVAAASQLVMVSGENWPDALAASRLIDANTRMALTRRDCQPTPLAAALSSGATRAITVVGGPAAVSDTAARGQTCAIGELPTPSPITTCQVPDARAQRTQPYSVGFPLTPGADGTPATGRFPVVVFPVDFPDVPGSQFDIDRMNQAVATADQWIASQSRGALSVDWRVSETWIHLQRPSIAYDTPKGGPNYIESAVGVAREIIGLADPTTDFSGNPFVFFVFPSTLRDVDTDVGYFAAQIATGEGRVAKFFGWGLFGNQYDQYGELRALWSFWIHEIGHTWGLGGHAPANLFGSDLLSPDLHVMDNQDGAVKLLSAWDQFLMGWYGSRDIHCLARDQVTSFEMPLDSRQSTSLGTKVLMIRLSSTRIMVIESHRPVGFGSRLAPHPGGVAAYVVDTSVDNDRSGEGRGSARTRYAQYLAPNNPPGSPSTRANVQALIVAGGSATHDGITVSVVSSGEFDTVRITRDSS